MSDPILPLPPEAVAQIQSSARVTSLNDVILGLLCNALDAEARSICIEVDYRRRRCTVEDDGLGIAPAEFHLDGGLAKLYREIPVLMLDTLAQFKGYLEADTVRYLETRE